MANWVADFLERNPEIACYPIVRRARHSLHFRMPGGVVGYFTGNPCHWWDGAAWQPLDTTLRRDAGRGRWYAPGVPVQVTEDGLVLVDGGHQQGTGRVGLYRPVTGDFVALKALPRGAADGDRYIRETDRYRHELRVTEVGLRETLTILEKPSLLARAGEYLAMETRISEASLGTGEVEEFLVGAMRFPTPTAEDGRGLLLPMRRWVVHRADGLYLYSGLALEVLETVTYPVTLDPNFSGHTGDGYIYGSAYTYGTARVTSSAFNTSQTYLLVGQRIYSSTYYVFRGYLKFDTSVIPDEATVQQVNLQLTAVSDDSGTDFDVQIVKQDWSGQDPITSSNMETAYDNCLSGTADNSIWRNTYGISTGTPYQSGDLDTSWVSKTGYTYYSLRSNRDKNGNTPTGDEYITIGATEHGTASYRPILIVAYSIAKALTGGWSGTGTITKKTAKGKSGTWSGTGSLLTSLLRCLSLAGSLAGEGILKRVALKGMRGSWLGTGIVRCLTAKTLAGTWSGAGQLARTWLLLLSGTWSGVGTLVRRTGKALAGAWSGIGQLIVPVHLVWPHWARYAGNGLAKARYVVSMALAWLSPSHSHTRYAASAGEAQYEQMASKADYEEEI